MNRNAVTLIALCAVPRCVSGEVLQREKIIEVMSQSIRVQNADEAQPEPYRNLIEVWPASVPSSFTVSSAGRSLAQISRMKVSLPLDDARLSDLRLQKFIMDVAISIKGMELIPTLTESERQSLVGSVDLLAAGLKLSIEKNFGHLLQRNEISAEVDRFRTLALSRIDDVLTYAMKTPLDTTLAQEWLRQFDDRLTATAGRVIRRFEEVERVECETCSEEQLASMRQERRGIVVTLLLQEVSYEVEKYLFTQTSPPELRGIRPDDWIPGYQQHVRVLNENERRYRSAKKANSQ